MRRRGGVQRRLATGVGLPLRFCGRQTDRQPSAMSHQNEDDHMHPALADAIDSMSVAAASGAEEAVGSPAASSASPGSLLPHQYAPQHVEVESAALSAEAEAAAAAAHSATLSIACTLQSQQTSQLLAALSNAAAHCFDAVVASMGLPRAHSSTPHTLSFTEPDTLMSASRWAPRVIGLVSDWVRLDGVRSDEPTHPDAALPAHTARLASEAAFKREVAWAVHLSLPALIVPNVTPDRCDNAARCINQALLQSQFLNIWLSVPLAAASAPFSLHASGDECGEDGPHDDSRDPWAAWNRVRNLCESHKRLGVCLEIGADLPPFLSAEAEAALDPTGTTSSAPDQRSAGELVVARWLGEPVRAVLLSTEVFGINKKGYPVLSKAHQALVRRLFDMKDVQWILRDADGATETLQLDAHSAAADADATSASGSSSSSSAAAGSGSSLRSLGLVPYQYYLRHLFSSFVSGSWSVQSRFEAPYRDYLQAPLQPLQENLESGVYEVFERDPVKYAKYEEAIALALVDLFPPSEDAVRPVAQVMVVGAGRGPLVRCVLRASASSGVPVLIHAIEKNPNAVLTLESLRLHDPAFKDVRVVSTDMRDWTGPAGASDGGRGFADLIVSELLGSFGDNELSPECLDGVLARFLRPARGVSIPSNSVSYLVPVSSSRLWSDVNSYDSLKNFETSYVCQMHNYFRASTAVQPCFKFVHVAPPMPGVQPQAELTEGQWTEEDNAKVVCAERERVAAVQEVQGQQNQQSDSASASAVTVPPPVNSRHTSLTFSIPLATSIHGFAGFFTSQLYKSVELSILPGPRFSRGMFSWFPLYFPIRAPLSLPSNSSLTVDMWRCTSPRKVWYEWAITAPTPSPIHNPNGRSSYIGL